MKIVMLIDDEAPVNNSAWYTGQKGHIFEVINRNQLDYYVVDNGVITTKILPKRKCKVMTSQSTN